MAKTTVYQGLNLAWGTPSGSVCTAFGNAKIQSDSTNFTGQEFELLDENGDCVSWVGYNQKREMTFEYYVSDSTDADGNAGAVKPTFGQKCTLTDPTSGGKRPHLTGSMIVKSVTINEANTDGTKISVNGTIYPNIS